MTYWGYRFETLSTIACPPSEVTAKVLQERVEEAVVDTHVQFCSVVRTCLGSSEIVMGAEVDCMMADVKPSQTERQKSYVELKTNRVLTTDNQQRSFERHKLLKVYFQSWLAGIETIIFGFRNDDGKLMSLETLKTREIPRRVRRNRDTWDAVVCINFADAMLEWLSQSILGAGPAAGRVYGISFVRGVIELSVLNEETDGVDAVPFVSHPL